MGIPLSQWFDTRPLDSGINERDDADEKSISWSFNNICNPPYNLTVLFWIKGAIKYLKGNNSAFIVQRWPT